MGRQKEFDNSLVLNKAMTTFWKQGYEKTSMQDLVNQMGINRSSIYDTFGDKHNLFLMSLDLYADKLEQLIINSVQPDTPLKIQLTDLFSLSIKSNPKGCLIVNTAVELSLLDNEIDKKVQYFFSKSESYIYSLLETAQNKKEIQLNTDLKKVASYLHNTWVGLRVTAKVTDDEKKLFAIIHTSLSIL